MSQLGINSQDTARPLSFGRLYLYALCAAGVVPVFVIVNIGIGLVMGETDAWQALLKWLGGYAAVSLVVAGVARAVLRQPRGAGILRRLVYVVLTTAILSLAALMVTRSVPSSWAVSGWIILFFLHIPVLFLLLSCRGGDRPAVRQETAEPRARVLMVGHSLFECALLALSPLLGGVYMCLGIYACAHGGAMVPVVVLCAVLWWAGAAAAVAGFLWLLRVSRRFWWLTMVAVLALAVSVESLTTAGEYPGWWGCCGVVGLLPVVYLAQRIRQLRCPQEACRPLRFRSDAACAALAGLSLPGMAVVVLALPGEDTLLMSVSALACWGILSALLWLLSVSILNEAATHSAMRRIVFVLSVCLVLSFLAFALDMNSDGCAFLAYAPGFLPVALLYLTLRRLSRG